MKWKRKACSFQSQIRDLGIIARSSANVIVKSKSYIIYNQDIKRNYMLASRDPSIELIDNGHKKQRKDFGKGHFLVGVGLFGVAA